jgi:hypothetical protein
LKQAQQISKDVLNKIDDLSKASLDRLVRGEEPITFDVPLFTISLQRIIPNDIDKISLSIGAASVQFPNSNIMFGPLHGMDQVGVKVWSMLDSFLNIIYPSTFLCLSFILMKEI